MLHVQDRRVVAAVEHRAGRPEARFAGETEESELRAVGRRATRVRAVDGGALDVEAHRSAIGRHVAAHRSQLGVGKREALVRLPVAVAAVPVARAVDAIRGKRELAVLA